MPLVYSGADEYSTSVFWIADRHASNRARLSMWDKYTRRDCCFPMSLLATIISSVNLPSKYHKRKSNNQEMLPVL